MDWRIVIIGVIVVAFIGLGLLAAAIRDRSRGEEVVDDLPERTQETERGESGLPGVND